MRVIVNTLPLLGKKTGIGKYTYYIVREFSILLRNKLFLYPHIHIEESFKFDNLKRTISKSTYLRKLTRMVMDVGLLLKGEFDVYFEPNFVPLKSKAKVVAVMVHDLTFLKFPKYVPQERREFLSKGFFERTINADIIFTPSEFVKKEIIENFPFLKGKVFSVPLGVDKRIFFPKEKTRNLEYKYILFVGEDNPRKNLKRLIKAYKMLRENIKKEYRLVVVGTSYVGKKDGIICTGYISEEKLANMYRNASLLVIPSLYEGFGLPAVEAMASCCPVLASRRGALPEVCGDSAFYIENPEDEEEIKLKLEILLENEDLRKQYALKGLELSSNYSWEKTAKIYFQIFKRWLE